MLHVLVHDIAVFDCVKAEYAGDALLVLLLSDFHTTGVVLERIVEDYKGGVVLTKIQDLLAGLANQDHIQHDLQYNGHTSHSKMSVQK